jgi:phosphoglycerol transferase MdoB-like AlkP superfamily enzyme
MTIEQKKNVSNENVAYIKTFGGVNNSNMQDADGDGMPDVMEFMNFNQKERNFFTTHMLNTRKQVFVEKKHADDVNLTKQKLKQESERTKVMAKKASSTK